MSIGFPRVSRQCCIEFRHFFLPLYFSTFPVDVARNFVTFSAFFFPPFLVSVGKNIVSVAPFLVVLYEIKNKNN